MQIQSIRNNGYEFSQAQRAAHLQGYAPAMDRRAQLFLAGEKQEAVEKLRANDQHQPAVPSSDLPVPSTYGFVP